MRSFVTLDEVIKNTAMSQNNEVQELKQLVEKYQALKQEIGKQEMPAQFNEELEAFFSENGIK